VKIRGFPRRGLGWKRRSGYWKRLREGYPLFTLAEGAELMVVMVGTSMISMTEVVIRMLGLVVTAVIMMIWMMMLVLPLMTDPK
jgi:hypothetical protein